MVFYYTYIKSFLFIILIFIGLNVFPQPTIKIKLIQSKFSFGTIALDPLEAIGDTFIYGESLQFASNRYLDFKNNTITKGKPFPFYDSIFHYNRSYFCDYKIDNNFYFKIVKTGNRILLLNQKINKYSTLENNQYLFKNIIIEYNYCFAGKSYKDSVIVDVTIPKDFPKNKEILYNVLYNYKVKRKFGNNIYDFSASKLLYQIDSLNPFLKIRTSLNDEFSIKLGDTFQIEKNRYLVKEFDRINWKVVFEKVLVKGEGYNVNQYISNLNLFDTSKNTLLYFTASWCVPCKKLADPLLELYKSKNNSIAVKAIYYESDKKVFANYVQSNLIPWQVFLDMKDDASFNTYRSIYKVKGYPTLFLVDKKGKILKRANDLSQCLDLIKSLN